MSNIQQLLDVHEHQHDFLASSWRPLPSKDSRPMGLCNSSCTPISGGKPCSRAATTSVAKDFRRRDLSPPGALGANNPPLLPVTGGLHLPHVGEVLRKGAQPYPVLCKFVAQAGERGVAGGNFGVETTLQQFIRWWFGSFWGKFKGVEDDPNWLDLFGGHQQQPAVLN